MARAKAHVLGCSGDVVSLEVLRNSIEELLVTEDESLLERTCVQVPSRSVPLCQADVLAAVGQPDGRLYERLATFVERRGRRRLTTSNNRLVRDLITMSFQALGACTALLGMLHDTVFDEVDRDLDFDARREVDVLASLLDQIADTFRATPLLIMAALVEGGLSGVVAAMLQGRDISELVRRGSLFHRVLRLIRSAAKLPDVAQLLASTTRAHGQHVSVLGCLSALATSARTLLGWELGTDTAAAAGLGAARRGEPTEAVERRRKMASRVVDTHRLLQEAVGRLTSTSVAAAAAPPPPPHEADYLARIAHELRLAQDAAATPEAPPAPQTSSSTSYYGLHTDRHEITGSLSSSLSGVGGAGGGGVAHNAPLAYDPRYAPSQWQPAPRSDGSLWALERTSLYGEFYGNYGGGGAYGENGPVSAALPPTYSGYPGGDVSVAAVEDLYGIWTGGLGAAVGAAADGGSGFGGDDTAAQGSLGAILRQQRELQRLHQAASGHRASAFVRDGLSHHSLAEVLTSPYDPMATPTLSYPWRTQQDAGSLTAAAPTQARGQQPVERQLLLRQHQHQPQGAYALLYEAVPAVTASGAASSAGGVVDSQKRPYSVPTTPQRAPSAVDYYNQHQYHQQQQQQHQEGSSHQMQALAALAERLMQLPLSGGNDSGNGGSATAATVLSTASQQGPQSYGKHLGGYSVAAPDSAPAANAIYPYHYSSVAAGGSAPSGGAAAQASVRSRSAVRQRMASAEGPAGVSSGVGGSGSLLLSADGGSGLGLTAATAPAHPGGPQTRTQAWADPQPWQQGPEQQQRQSQAASRGASWVGAPAARQHHEVAVAGGGGRSTVVAGARPGSVSRMRPVATEGGAGAGAGGAGVGRAATAWSAVPSEALRSQQQQPQQLQRVQQLRQQQQRVHGSTATGAAVSAELSHPASISASLGDAAYHYGGASHGGPSTARSSGGSSRSSSGGSSSAEPQRSRGGGGGSTLRALVADFGLPPGLSRSPGDHRRQHHPSQPQAQPRHAQQQERSYSRPQSAPRTAVRQAAPPPRPPSGGGFLDRHAAVERQSITAAGIDPRIGPVPGIRSGGSSLGAGGCSGGGAPAPVASPRSSAAGATSASVAVSASTSAMFQQQQQQPDAYPSAHAVSPPGAAAAARPSAGPYVIATHTGNPAAVAVSPTGTARHQHNVWETSAATAAAAVIGSDRWDVPKRSGSGAGGSSSSSGAAVAAAPAQRYSSPYRGAAGPAAGWEHSPAPSVAARQPSAPASADSGMQSGIGGATFPAVARHREAEALQLATATAAGDAGATSTAAALARRRMPAATAARSRSSSDADQDDDDNDADLQYALRLSRLEAEATAEAAVLAASTATPTAVALAAAAPAAAPLPGSPRAAPSASRTTHRSPASAGSGSSDRRQQQQPPSPQRALALVPSGAGIDDNGGGGGMLVGGAVPLTVLHQRYAILNPLLAAKLVSLEDDFPSTRRVAGDGNCFYRAALFALMEHVLTAPDWVMAERLEAVFRNCVRRLEAASEQQETARGGDRGGGPRSRAATPERGRVVSSSGGGGGSSAASTPSGGAAAAAEAGGADPAAVQGGKRLLRLLRNAWFKATDGDSEPCDVASLERLLNHSAHSAEVIRFARRLTEHELRSDEAFYAPFIPGCGGDYGGMDLTRICEQHVLPMGVEVEQLQIIALCRALGATLGVLDVAGSQVGAIKHGPAGHSDMGPPVAWVAHLPGHYDVVYPARRLDVAPGGVLVPAREE